MRLPQKNYSACLLIMLPCFALMGRPAAAQNTVEAGPIADYHLVIGSAIAHAAQNKDAVLEPLTQLQKELTAYETAISAGRLTASEAMASNLHSSALALKDILTRLEEPQSVLLVHALSDDLSLKNAATEYTYKLAGGPRMMPDVTVRINVTKNGVPVNGYGAILVPRRYAEDQAWKDGKLADIPFGAAVSSKFTPRAVASVLPGAYWIQIYKTLTRLASLPTVVSISTEEIDVSVP